MTALAAVEASSPQPGETVDRLDAGRLTFAVALSQKARHSIRLVDDTGTRLATGPVRVKSERTVSLAVRHARSAAGPVTVRWCAVGADGHSQRGAYQFSYAGPTSSVATSQAAGSDCAASAARGAVGGDLAAAGRRRRIGVVPRRGGEPERISCSWCR